MTPNLSVPGWMVAHRRLRSAPEPSVHRPRRSACADAALRAEIEYVKRMTIEERVKAALTMLDRFNRLLPVPAKKAEFLGEREVSDARGRIHQPSSGGTYRQDARRF